MKKIFDWTIGSFFRTFGRIIAFIVLGAIMVYLGQKSGIKVADLLGIQRVYASTSAIYSSSVWSIRTVNPSFQNCTDTGSNNDGVVCATNNWLSSQSLGSYYEDTSYATNSVLVSDIRFFTYTSELAKFQKDRYYTFDFTVCQSSYRTLTSNSLSNLHVTQWGYNTSNQATGSTISSGSEVSLVLSEIEGTTTIHNTPSYCYHYKLSVTPKVDSRYIGFYLQYVNYNNEFAIMEHINQAGTLFSVQDLSVSYESGSDAVIQDSTNQIINNQNQNTQSIINSQTEIKDSVNDLEDSILDDNISDNDITDALNISLSENSFGPFSGFLMLPLTWIQSLLVPQDSCQAINIPLPFLHNRYLTLPCMNDFWDSLGGLADLITVVWIAIVGVRIFNGLYLLTIETTSSKGNAEQLYKIRSWEL